MITVAKALKIVTRQVVPSVTLAVPLTDSVARILAENIEADTDLPPFHRSQMDGFAVRFEDTANAPVELKIVGESAAGNGWHNKLKRGEAVRIMTGAPVPDGANAVQRVELTSESGNIVTFREAVTKGTAIVKRGAEIQAGKVVFNTGERITEKMIAALASFGYAKVRVSASPRVAILATGSEIVDINKKPKRDQIRNSNSVMLDVMCRKVGAVTTILPNVRDDISALRTQISAAAKGTDIVILTGGVSVGKYDHTKAVLSDLGAEIFFDKVRLKPGKPMVFARLGKTLIFGLPGNPVSAAVTFHLFARKALLQMQGASSTDLRQGVAVLAADVKAANERETYLPSRLESNMSGQLIAIPLKWQGSSDFIGFARADALVFVPNGREIKAGDVATVLFL